ncbi:hypothetical protein [Hymenobacter sublimis]|uniref:DUF4230 domain-containing protein n=1 Tax=Hymenobacter sublimis TaxID=2933777 RepID=A0ABY4JCL5_9BACT|nr:hypothetical protein [Hymenobacter sublimis]UPL50557.1 hypothetical protein MWH26_06520 [Hymenobacter sublimis]
MNRLEEFLALLAKYNKEISFIGVILTSIIALIGVILNIIYNRLNKRDELRQSSLIGMRNKEMQAYMSSIATSLSLIKKGLVILIEKDTALIKYREDLFEAQNNYIKASLNLSFLLPENDAKVFSGLDNELMDLLSDMIALVTSSLGKEHNGYSIAMWEKVKDQVTDEIVSEVKEHAKKDREMLDRQTEKLNKLKTSSDVVIRKVYAISPQLQVLVRKYNGL